MNKEIFTNTLIKELERVIPGAECTAREMQKGGALITGIVISTPEAKETGLIPTVYPDFNKPVSWNVKSILNTLEDDRDNMQDFSRDDILADFMNWETAQKKISFELRPRTENTEQVCRSFLNLEMIARYHIDDTKSIVIESQHLENWNISPAELFSLEPEPDCRIYDMMQMIDAIYKKSKCETVCLLDADISKGLFVATNSSKNGGALAGFNKTMLEAICKGHDIYIIPSSRHECILAPADMAPAADMLELVKTVNGEVVAPEDLLADNVYLYDHKTKQITIAA